MTDISTLVGGADHIGRSMGGQRARVMKPPAALDGALTVSLIAYANDYEYEVPGTNWVSRGTALPAKGDVGVAVFDDHGDAWFMVGGGTEFPAGGGGGTETDPIASAALTAHAADTTAIHGIADTSLLVVTSDTRLTNARTPTAHHTTHEPGGSDAMVVDAAAATGSLRTLGSGAAQAAPGNDARLSDQRVPTDGSVTNAKVAAAAAILRSKLDFGSGLVNADIAAAAGILKSKLAALNIVNADVDPAAAIAKTKLANLDVVNADVNAAAAIAESKLNLATDAAAGTGSRRTLGPGALQAAPGNDARLSDARTPTAHTHPASDVASGVLAVARLGSGTPAAGTYVDGGSGAWTTLPAAGGAAIYDDLQQGVVAAGDCALTFNSATQVTIAAGTVYVTASGVLTRATPTSTVLGSIPAASAANFRLDQVVVSSTGVVSRLAGTQGTTVTLANRTGAAAIPAGSLLLHDLLVTATGVVNNVANIRDRRPWARGAFVTVISTAGSVSLPAATYTALGVATRLECSGNPIVIEASIQGTSAAAVSLMSSTFTVDGTAVYTGQLGSGGNPTTTSVYINLGFTVGYTPTPGSHVFELTAQTSAGTASIPRSTTAPVALTLTESIRASAKNG